MSSMRRRLISAARVAMVLALLLGIAACGGGGDFSGGGGGIVGGDEGGDGGGGGFPAPGEGPAEDADSGEDRQVVTTGWMTLVVPDPLKGAEQATRIVEAAGGRVDDQTEEPGSPEVGARASLTLRIPATRVTSVLEEIEVLGELRDLSLSREDVTLTVRDLDARIRALEVSIGRLEDLMASATSTADLLEAERALTERQAELDSLRAQRTVIGEQVALATVRLELLAQPPLTAPSPGGFWGGVTTGWKALLATLDGSIAVIGAIVPWALFGGVIAGIWVLVRRARPARPAPVPRVTQGRPPKVPTRRRAGSDGNAPSGGSPSPTPYPANGGTQPRVAADAGESSRAGETNGTS